MKTNTLSRFAKLILLAACVLVMALDNPLAAQPPGRGGSSGRGGPGGGPADFLRRLDANGNGMIDPDEQGRARPFLERISSQLRLDLSRPIPLERISQGLERMRQQQSGGSSSRSGGSRSSNDGLSSGSRFREAPSVEPLIPGFGEPEDLDIIPGFGPLADSLDVEIAEDDRKEAEQTMRRYDRNRDGILDANEIRQGRWRDNPLAHDRNRDGKLTISELSARYSIRRSTTQEREEQARQNQQNSSSRSGASRGGGSSGGSSRGGGSSGGGASRWGGGGGSSGGDSGDRMAAFSNSLMQRYDSNRSGVLEKDEWKNFRTDPSAADKNKDNKITKEELSGWMQNRFSRGGSGASGGATGGGRGGSGGGNSGQSGNASGSSGEGSGSYRYLLPQERLPKGLPDWFTSRDKNADGQIRMSEFATAQWTQKTLSEYYKFDLNKDGVITSSECLQAVETGAVTGVSSSRSSSRSRSGDSESADKAGDGKSADKAGDGEIDTRYMKYAVGKIRDVDLNKDGVLTKDEWSRSSSFSDAMDTDKDGKLTPAEYARAVMKK
jgi:Ca2+-binding EF-hand superfamily protein